MALPAKRFSEILSGRYKNSIAFTAGLSIGGLGLVAMVYVPNATTALSADAFVLSVGLFLLAAWGGVGLRVLRSSQEAEKLAEMLANPNRRMTFDRVRNRIVIEEVEQTDLGLGLGEAVCNRAEISLEEAQLIGVAMDTSRARPLLGAAVPLPKNVVQEVASARPVEPTTVANAM